MARHVLALHILGSGSKGNCALVEGPQGLVMIDDGFSRREALRRMRELGIDEDRVKALILTHEHTDHVSGVGVWSRRFAGPLFASEGTPAARRSLEGSAFETFAPGDELTVAGIRVTTFSTSHDVVNPVGFRFECRGDAVSFATDSGVVSPGARAALADARILALESNHDVAMLKTGDYPAMVKARILSEQGHLSNDQAAEAARELVTDRTEQLVAMHLSQDNNRPSIAVRTLAAALGAELDNELGSSATRASRGAGGELRIRAAGQNRPITVR